MVTIVSMIEMEFAMMNLLHFAQMVLLMMIEKNVFSYVDQDLFAAQNIYHNVYIEMVVHVYEYFECVVVDSMKSKNFDYKTCIHMAVLVKKKRLEFL